MHEVQIGIVYFPEGFGVAPHIGMVNFRLPAVSVPNDRRKVRGHEVDPADLERGHRGSPQRRNDRLNGSDGPHGRRIPHRLGKNMAGGKVPLVRSFLLGPPHFAEDVRHAAEVLSGRSVPGPGVKKTEDVVLPVGQHIHGNENVRKVEGRVTDIQRLDETDPHVQLVTEPLPAVGGAVAAAARYLGRAAGKAAIDFSPVPGFGYDDEIVHCLVRRCADTPLFAGMPAALITRQRPQKATLFNGFSD